jgi:addiction module HigA family antidote
LWSGGRCKPVSWNEGSAVGQFCDTHEEFLAPLALSQYQLAKEISVPPRRINEIVHGQRRITADTALRLARFFGTSERFWLNLQARYDLEVEKDRLGGTLDDIRPMGAAS